MNFYELFDLSPSFKIDMDVLKANFHKLQLTTHPDKFAHASDQEKRIAMQNATMVNEGYQVLCDPVSRARHLLQICGVDEEKQAVSVNDPVFLLQQMEWRETLEAIQSAAPDNDAFDKLGKLIEDISLAADELQAKMSDRFDSRLLDEIPAMIGKLQFYSKLITEAESVEADLENKL